MKNSLSPQQEKLEQLKQLLPEVFTEGKVDWEKLKLSLGEDINIKNERYILNWAGKGNAYKVLQEPTSKTLSPDKNESVDFDKTENLFIEGDNLEALKILQKSYFGKVKMIYIDPPYNTGNDSFIYPDRFKENLEDYQKNVGDKDEEGYLIQNSIFKKNRKENGQYHSNWLNMMMPRLYLAKNLLRDDGVIFISIDDNEVHNLRLLMNEIFGEENFVDQIIWKKRYGGGGKEKYLVTLHEYILFYTKSITSLLDITIPLKEENIQKYYKLRDQNYDLRGSYRTHPLEATKSMGERKNLVFSILAPDGSLVYPKRQWLWSKERVEESLKRGEIEFLKNNDGGWTVHSKQYLKNEDGKIRDGKAFSIIDNVYSQHGTNEILHMFGNAQFFSFPKPVDLIRQLLEISSQKNDIFLDLFAGSGTTAHAVMQLNAEDGGHRKCISIQLPEVCEETSEAFKAGYKTIADIAKERIRRAGKKIKEDNKAKENIDQLDIGFKVLKVSDSNFKEWRTDISSEKLDEQLDLHVDPIAENASTENMLYELMLKNGKDLNSNIKHHNNIYSISDQENHNENILVLLLEEVNESIIESVLQENPNKVIALDKLFKNNDQLKTNTALQMQDADIKFETI